MSTCFSFSPSSGWMEHHGNSLKTATREIQEGIVKGELSKLGPFPLQPKQERILIGKVIIGEHSKKSIVWTQEPWLWLHVR